MAGNINLKATLASKSKDLKCMYCMIQEPSTAAALQPLVSRKTSTENSVGGFPKEIRDIVPFPKSQLHLPKCESENPPSDS